MSSQYDVQSTMFDYKFKISKKNLILLHTLLPHMFKKTLSMYARSFNWHTPTQIYTVVSVVYS